jgi:hypothetical protein
MRNTACYGLRQENRSLPHILHPLRARALKHIPFFVFLYLGYVYVPACLPAHIRAVGGGSEDDYNERKCLSKKDLVCNLSFLWGGLNMRTHSYSCN